MSRGDPVQLATAKHLAEQWIEEWSLLSEGLEYHICGSIRRGEEQVRDIDILVIDPSMHGTLSNSKYRGMLLNIYYVRKDCEGAGLLFLTGSADFNIRLRRRAKGMGMKLNRYGLWRGDKLVASKTEKEIFTALDMEFIAPAERRQPGAGATGIAVVSSDRSKTYQVFVKDIHGYNFCQCRGFQYRQHCSHITKVTGDIHDS